MCKELWGRSRNLGTLSDKMFKNINVYPQKQQSYQHRKLRHIKEDRNYRSDLSLDRISSIVWLSCESIPISEEIFSHP